MTAVPIRSATSAANHFARRMRELAEGVVGIDMMDEGEDTIAMLLANQTAIEKALASFRHIDAGAMTALRSAGDPSTATTTIRFDDCPDGTVRDLEFNWSSISLHYDDATLYLRLADTGREASDSISLSRRLLADLSPGASPRSRAAGERLVGILMDAATEVLGTLTAAVAIGCGRSAAASAVDRIRTAMEASSAMMDAVRPDHAGQIEIDPVACTMSVFVEDPSAFDARTGMMHVPLSGPLADMMPKAAVTYVKASRETEPFVSFRTGSTPMPSPPATDPMKTARLVRLHGGDGSELAAAIDRTLGRTS